MSARGLALGGFVAVVLAGAPAQAQEPAAPTAPAPADVKPTDPGAAQRLFDEAKALVGAGRWQEACPRLAESLRLERNMTTEFRLADCYEHTGRTASAWKHYSAVAKDAAASGESDKERVATERAAKLEPRIDKVVVMAPSAKDVRVERDGIELDAAALGTPQPIDPGEHTIHAFAAGRISFATVFKTPGTGATVKVAIPALEEAPASWRAPLRTMATIEPTPSAPIGERESRSSGSELSTVGVVLGVFGVAPVALGAGLYAHQAGTPEGCSGGRCVGPAILFSVGIAAVAVGAALVIHGFRSH